MQSQVLGPWRLGSVNHSRIVSALHCLNFAAKQFFRCRSEFRASVKDIRFSISCRTCCGDRVLNLPVFRERLFHSMRTNLDHERGVFWFCLLDAAYRHHRRYRRNMLFIFRDCALVFKARNVEAEYRCF